LQLTHTPAKYLERSPLSESDGGAESGICAAADILVMNRYLIGLPWLFANVIGCVILLLPITAWPESPRLLLENSIQAPVSDALIDKVLGAMPPRSATSIRLNDECNRDTSTVNRVLINDVFITMSSRRQVNNHYGPNCKVAGRIGTKTSLIAFATFEDAWLQPFNPAKTHPSQWTTATGQKLSVPMMFSQGLYGFIQYKDYSIVDVPFRDQRFSLFLLTSQRPITSNAKVFSILSNSIATSATAT